MSLYIEGTGLIGQNEVCTLSSAINSTLIMTNDTQSLVFLLMINIYTFQLNIYAESEYKSIWNVHYIIK